MDSELQQLELLTKTLAKAPIHPERRERRIDVCQAIFDRLVQLYSPAGG